MSALEVIEYLVVEYVKSRGADYGIKKVKNVGERARERGSSFAGHTGHVELDREIGAPSIPTPVSTIPSKRRQGRASAEHGKHRGPRRESRRGGRARRKECPKGYYWSYKKKKCMKSKY